MIAEDSDRQLKYERLVQARRNCECCKEHDLVNPSKYPDWDKAIGPWSFWQGSLKAEVLLVGQDWGTVKHFEDNKGRDPDEDPTNHNLVQLFSSIGSNYKISEPRSGDYQNANLFFTNLVLCLKPGRDMSAKLPAVAMTNCAEKFLKPLIYIIRPKVVVALGNVYKPILKSFGISKDKIPRSVRAAVEMAEGIYLTEDTMMFTVFHCGHNGYRNRGGIETQEKDWKRIGNYLKNEGTQLM